MNPREGARCASGISLLVAVWLLGATPAAAQSVDVKAGHSTLYDATGGTLAVRGDGYEAVVSAGELGGHFRTGLALRIHGRAGSVVIGDYAVGFDLPTDLFGGAQYLPLRGIGFEVRRPGGNLLALAGATTQPVGVPFVSAASVEAPAAILFADRRVSRGVRLVSRNVLGRQLTSIHGAEWLVATGVTLGASAGVGSNAPYAVAGLRLARWRLESDISFISTSPDFRRVTLSSIASAERVRDNVSMKFHPWPRWQLSAARQHYLDRGAKTTDQAVVSVRQASTDLRIAGFQVSAGVFLTDGARTHHRGQTFGISRTLGSRLDVTVGHFLERPLGGGSSHQFNVTLRERLTQRLTLSQWCNQDGLIRLGGQWLSNLMTVSVDHQMVYVPLRPERPFVNAAAVNVALRPWGNLQLQVGSQILPTGRVRYSVSASQWLQRASKARPVGTNAFRFPKYIIQGRVVDDAGNPIARASLTVGAETVLSGKDGRFFVRSRSSKPQTLRVLSDTLDTGGYYTAVNPLGLVTPVPDGTASEIVLILRRVSTPAPDPASTGERLPVGGRERDHRR